MALMLLRFQRLKSTGETVATEGKIVGEMAEAVREWQD